MSDTVPHLGSFQEVLDWLNGVERENPHREVFYSGIVREERWVWNPITGWRHDG